MARGFDPGVEIWFQIGHPEGDGSLIEALAGRVYGSLDGGSGTTCAGAEVDDCVGVGVYVGYVIEDALQESGGEGGWWCGLENRESLRPLRC